MKIFKLTGTIPALALVFSAGVANAATSFDADVTPDVIFGSGNANGSFTVDRANNVELGLRAKLRYNLGGAPENTFNSNGDGTYTFFPSEGNPPTGLSIFNFEWSVNSNLSGAGERALDALTYLLEIDYDPTTGTNFTSFDPINQSFEDHAIGDNSTGNSAGAVAVNDTGYSSLIATNNVAQNSWNLGWFEPSGFDPQTEGLYTFRLSAFDGTAELASSAIDVQVGNVPAAPVPLPAAGWLLLSAVGGLGLAARRRRKAA